MPATCTKRCVAFADVAGDLFPDDVSTLSRRRSPAKAGCGDSVPLYGRHFLMDAILPTGISHYNAFRFGRASQRPVLVFGILAYSRHDIYCTVHTHTHTATSSDYSSPRKIHLSFQRISLESFTAPYVAMLKSHLVVKRLKLN